MSFIISIILLFLGYLLGLFIFSFTIIPVLIILRFGIPYTKHLKKSGLLLSDNSIIRNYCISIFTLLPIFVIGTLLANKFLGTSLAWGYDIGCVYALLTGFAQTNANQVNTSDYLKTNSRYLLNK